jgi:hypothetical protein
VIVTTATEAARLRLDRQAAELVRLARGNPFADAVGESRRAERTGFLARGRTSAHLPSRHSGGRMAAGCAASSSA